MTQLYDDRASKYETTLANLSEMFAEARQTLQEALSDPDWADSVENARAEIVMINRVEKDIFYLFGNAY